MIGFISGTWIEQKTRKKSNTKRRRMSKRKEFSVLFPRLKRRQHLQSKRTQNLQNYSESPTNEIMNSRSIEIYFDSNNLQ